MIPHRKVTIALDFDCTFTADIEFWRMFIHFSTLRGHRVVMITARHDTTENRTLLSDVVGHTTLCRLMALLFTDRKPKRGFAEERGYKIDIWIDDLPEFVGGESLEVLEQLKAKQSIIETLPIVELGAVCPHAIWEPHRDL